jgi:hypothetical protein
VTRLALRIVEAIVLPTIALAVVAAVAPGRLGLALQIYALLLAAIALLGVLSGLRRAYPPPERSVVDEALEREPSEPDAPPSDLARIEREVTLGVASTYDFHFRLRPTLRETAAALLAVRRGIDLDREPDRARQALGDEIWELVRPDRPPPEDRLARGLEPARLRRAVEALEAL